MNDPAVALIGLLIGLAMVFVSVYVIIRYGVSPALGHMRELEITYDRVLRQRLLMDIEPRFCVWMTLAFVVMAFLLGTLLGESMMLGLFFAMFAGASPWVLMKHFEQKRREKLDAQLVDALTTLASGVRAGLPLMQSMELLVRNSTGPVKQEFAQMLREYQMGADLNQAMRNTSNRIGSPLYRLTFTAIEMHRLRGGDAGESMDRIAESVREIQRLEGKLDALTSQGRSQANMMAAMAFVFIGMYYFIAPENTTMLFTDAWGRLILLLVAVLIATGFFWIRRIMRVDI